jgi:hypothetical protein
MMMSREPQPTVPLILSYFLKKKGGKHFLASFWSYGLTLLRRWMYPMAINRVTLGQGVGVDAVFWQNEIKESSKVCCLMAVVKRRFCINWYSCCIFASSGLVSHDCAT